MHKMSIPASVDAQFLRTLAQIGDPWGYGPSDDPAFQWITFEAEHLDDVLAALDGYDTAWLDQAKASKIAEVNLKRDLRIAGGFTFDHGGETYPIQSRQSDRENVIGLAVAAMGAIGRGAQPNDLGWLGTEEPFGFIAEDNRIFALDAQGMMALYQRGLSFKMGVTLYARGLKDALLAAPDLAALAAIETETGWPA